MSKQKTNKQPELSMDDLEQITFDAMRHFGAVPPITVDEIASIEAELPNIKLPFSIRDPRELLEQLEEEGDDVVEQILPFPQTTADCVSNLARAARKGGTLSAEIEQQMAEDKARHLQSEHGNE